MTESKKNRTLSTKISEDLHKKVKSWCVTNEKKIQDFIEDALEAYLSQKGENNNKVGS